MECWVPICRGLWYLILRPPLWTSPLTMASCIMEHLSSTPLDIGQFLGMLVVMLAVAKAGGFLMQKLGQPAVLGELIGGILVG